MRKRLSQAWDFFYAAVYGLLAAIGVATFGGVIAVGAGARGETLSGWEAVVLAIGACVGILAAHVIRAQRRRDR